MSANTNTQRIPVTDLRPGDTLIALNDSAFDPRTLTEAGARDEYMTSMSAEGWHTVVPNDVTATIVARV